MAAGKRKRSTPSASEAPAVAPFAKLPGADCGSCPSRKSKLVPCQPAKLPLQLIVVGEYPDSAAEEAKRPFGGSAERFLLHKLKRQAGIDPDAVHFTNAVACPTPKEDMTAAVRCCRGRVLQELSGLPAAPVLALGAHALQVVVGFKTKRSITAANKNPGFHGSVIDLHDPVREIPNAPRLILPTLSPKFTLKAPLWEPIFDTDLMRAGRVVRNGYTAPERQPGRRCVVVDSVDSLRGELGKLDVRVAFDIETTGLYLLTVDMVCFVISDTHTAVVVPWTKTQFGEGMFFNGRTEEAVEIINAALATRITTTHNGPLFDHPIAARFGIKPAQWEDTMTGYHVLTSHLPRALSHVVGCFVDAPPWKHWNHGTDLRALWEYCGRDGLYTQLAADELFKQFDENDWRVYESDKQSALVCQEMARNGFAFDSERAAVISARLREREEELRLEAVELTGIKKLSLFSPKQLQKLFFGQLGARVCFVSAKTGEPCLDVEALMAYSASSNAELARMSLLTLEARSVRKCRATYIDGVHIHTDGRTHPTWLSYGTETGRFAARKPSLPTLPKKQNDPAHKLGFDGGIRSLYVAPPGRKLCYFDVAQMEFRVAAYLTGDPNMMAACEASDIHAVNAVSIFGKRFAELPLDSPERKKLRDITKPAGFACIYGAEAPTVHSKLVAQGFDVSFQQVEAMMNALKQSFRVYYEFVADNVSKTIRRGYVESPLLKRKRFLGHNPEPPKVANYPIQSGAADIFNMKAWEIYNRLSSSGLDAKLVAAVYDALIIDTAEDDVPAVLDICREVWAAPVMFDGRACVLPIDLRVGEKWSDF
jgi:uracil-DNA glycosylase family 4